MTRPPPRFRSADPLAAAEAVFRPSAPAPAPARAPKSAGLPVSKEQVTLKLDSDVLAHFQEDGPGWQERVNAVLRSAAGL